MQRYLAAMFVGQLVYLFARVEWQAGWLGLWPGLLAFLAVFFFIGAVRPRPAPPKE